MHLGPKIYFLVPAVVVGLIAIVSLLVGKTLYASFGGYFIAHRRRDPGHFWVGVIFDFVFALMFAVTAILV